MAPKELILTDDVARMMGIRNARVTAREDDVHTTDDFYQRDMYLSGVKNGEEENFADPDVKNVK